jgi:hypothetical protein
MTDADEYNGETFMDKVIFHSLPLKDGKPELILPYLEQLNEVTTLIIFTIHLLWFSL